MKRRTLITVIILLSLFLSAIPVHAGAMTQEVKKSTQIPATFNGNLADSINTLPDGHHDNFRGTQDQFSCRAEGWAADPDNRGINLNVRILSDGVEVAQTIADTFRQDLADAGVCAGGACSFSVNLWGLISPNTDHVITVQAQDAQTGEWSNLYDTPKTLNCFQANSPVEGYHDGPEGRQNSFFCLAEGWVIDHNDLNLDLNVRILSDGVEVAQTIADRYRQDLDEGGACPGGTCSFKVDLASLISLGVDHSIAVQAQDPQSGEWVDLNNTPKTLNCFEAQAQTFIVNSTGDLGDVVPGNGVCETSTLGECTLRAAIMESNANPGTDAINFNIPGAGPHTISPTYGFDFISDPVIIDATTQPDFTETPVIELDGSNAGTDTYGIVVFAGSSTVRGLAINRFALTGIDLDVNGGNTIQGNYIGTDLTGTINLGNGANGIAISQGSGGNLIGGTVAGVGNIISGNGENGIVIADPGSNGNVIQGNLIGTDVSGTLDLGNSIDGVGIDSNDNLIGGTAASARNVISGNDRGGVTIFGANANENVVQGNYIGTDANGSASLANYSGGVVIGVGASGNTIGGTAAGAGNLLSGNGDLGVLINDTGTEHNVIQGNFIGTDEGGSASIPNNNGGVRIGNGATNNSVGPGNVISGNGGSGLVIEGSSSSANTVEGNIIGADVTGTLNLGNADDGVLLLAPNNTIGGTTPTARNIISGNQEQGIRMQGSEASGNIVQGNFIGADSTGMVALGNGTDCCHSGVVLHLGASNNIIGGITPGAGNVISGNTADGVTIVDAGTTGNVVAGNHIGTDVSGTRDLGNSSDGVNINQGASDNVIGGTAAGAGNVISGNGDFGVLVGYGGTSGNQVQGNFIGTDANGSLGIANASGGIGIFGPTSDNLIGGTTAAARNIISGNGGSGVNICCDGSTRNLVKGNFIGTDVNGTLGLGNAGDGVSISQSADNTIGGIEAGARNLISGNQSNGVGIYDVGTTGNLVQGNYIGTDITGMVAVGNSLDGVVICCGGASGNTVGGTALGAGNLISGNNGSGIGIYDNTTANVIQGNLIGTNATGTGSLGNGANGIGMAGGPTNNMIGGTTNGAPNTIAFNGANGIDLTTDAGTGNVISSNSIYSNGSLGIDLGENGVTLNDLFDADSGPNNLQNFPIITAVKSKGKGTTVQGSLISAGNTTFQIRFFGNDSCDPSNYGEGQTYLGFTTVKTNPTGLANFKITLQAPLGNGVFITATATDPTNNTSEFSRCMHVTR